MALEYPNARDVSNVFFVRTPEPTENRPTVGHAQFVTVAPRGGTPQASACEAWATEGRVCRPTENSSALVGCLQDIGSQTFPSVVGSAIPLLVFPDPLIIPFPRAIWSFAGLEIVGCFVPENDFVFQVIEQVGALCGFDH